MNAAVVIGGINLVDLIEDYAIRHQRAETVRKPRRDQELISRRFVQFNRQMLAVGRGRASQIDDHVEDSSSQYPNELGLSKAAAPGSAGHGRCRRGVTSNSLSWMNSYSIPAARKSRRT